ncbi:MAG: DUF2703 domain-containing protein [Clostridia bacterium]|jgi:hypothetical protein|nr:DUF2703 domain-containing protein [Clostridia bacterium]MBT7121717.1 DUF2703 domain-containing protein [Clostridia bacterium]
MSEIKFPGDYADTGCIAPKKPQPILIDFLYLKDSTDSWQTSLSTLNEAIDELSNLLNSSGLYIEVRQTLIDSIASATAHKFICSPTIAINGIDITESHGYSVDDTNCRVWLYKGAEYNTAPQPLIVSAIIKAIYGATIPIIERPYRMPSNLKEFLDTKPK